MQDKHHRYSPENQDLLRRRRFGELEPDAQTRLSLNLAARVGFGDDHLYVDYDNRHKAAEGQLRAFISKGGMPNSIWIAGPSQSGKTALLCCMLKQMFVQWAKKQSCPAYLLPASFARWVILITHEEYVGVRYDEYRSENAQDLLYQQLATTPLLLFDDLGAFADSGSGHNLSKLEQLIDERSRHLRATWITSNISAKDMSRRREWSRIYGRLTKKKWIVYSQILK